VACLRAHTGETRATAVGLLRAPAHFHCRLLTACPARRSGPLASVSLLDVTQHALQICISEPAPRIGEIAQGDEVGELRIDVLQVLGARPMHLPPERLAAAPPPPVEQLAENVSQSAPRHCVLLLLEANALGVREPEELKVLVVGCELIQPADDEDYFVGN